MYPDRCEKRRGKPRARLFIGWNVRQYKAAPRATKFPILKAKLPAFSTSIGTENVDPVHVNEGCFTRCKPFGRIPARMDSMSGARDAPSRPLSVTATQVTQFTRKLRAARNFPVALTPNGNGTEEFSSMRTISCDPLVRLRMMARFRRVRPRSTTVTLDVVIESRTTIQP